MSGIKEPPGSVFSKKNQNQRTSGSGFLKILIVKRTPSSSFSLNLKEPTSLMKYPDKNQKFYRK
jgi:hypothetical protein